MTAGEIHPGDHTATSEHHPDDAGPDPLSERQRRLVLVLAVLCAATRFLALARSLWDWDEVLFVLGMRDYDVTLHHPHPPGFPVYIAAAKLLRFVMPDDFRSLQALNLIAAILVFPAVYLFARELRFRFETCISAAMLFAFFPNVWFFGGTGFSDIPSIVLVLFAVTLLLRGRRHRGSYWVGTLLLALSIGIRPQNFLIGLVPGLLATRRRRPSEVAFALLIGLFVAGVAYGGAIEATGSLHDYVRVVREHADYISRVDSWRSPVRPALWRITDRFFVKQYQSPALSIAATLFVLVSIAGSIRARSRPMLLNVLTFAPFAISAWLMLDRFSVSRFSIGYQPMFALLVADGIHRTAGSMRVRRRRTEIAVVAILVVAFVAFTLPALQIVRTSFAPSVLAAQALNGRIDPARERLFVGHTMSKFVDLYAPDLPYTRVIDDRALPLTDPPRAWLLAEITKTPADGLVFRREKSSLWSIARRHYFDVKLVPLAKRARFVSGWSEPEIEDIHEWRSMGRHSVTILPPAAGRTKLRMHLGVPAELALRNPRITVRVNGEVVGEFNTTETYFERNYNVMPAHGENRLELTIDGTVEKDNRHLGMRLRYLGWGPA